MKNYKFIFYFIFIILFSCDKKTVEYEVSELSTVALDSAVVLSWIEPDEKDFAGSLIYYGPTQRGVDTKVDMYKGEVYSYGTKIENLENGIEYMFVVVSQNVYGNISQGITVRSKPFDLDPPGMITDFQTKIGSGEIELSWTNPDDDDFSHCVVWSSFQLTGESKSHITVSGAPGSQSKVNVSKLTNGYNYNFFIKAVDRSGNSSDIFYHYASADGIPPKKVVFNTDDSYLKKDNEDYYAYQIDNDPNGGKITVRWTNPDDEDFLHTEVRYGLFGSMSKKYLPLSDIKLVESGYHRGKKEVTVDNLINGRKYEFVFSTVDKAGNVNDLRVKPIMPMDGVAPIITIDDNSPDVNVIVYEGNSQIIINWQKLIEETPDYKSFSYTREIAGVITEESFSGDEFESIISGLINDEEYELKFTAYDRSGNKTETNYQKYKPKEGALPEVKDLQAVRGDGNASLYFSLPDESVDTFKIEYGETSSLIPLAEFSKDDNFNSAIGKYEYKIEGLQNRTKYYIKLSVNIAGNYSRGVYTSVVPDIDPGTPVDVSIPDPVNLNLNFKYISPISFSMGMPVVADNYHDITLTKPYQLAAHETSYELWYKVRVWAEANGYSFANKGMPGNAAGPGVDFTLEIEGESVKDQPVAGVSWYDAIVWCNALSQLTGKTPVYTISTKTVKDAKALKNDIKNLRVENSKGFRLPTEAEWELAARYIEDDYGRLILLPPSGISCDYDAYKDALDDTGQYFEYNNIPVFGGYTWYYGNSNGRSKAITDTRTAPNFLGLQDMSGNVSEWCYDWHDYYPEEVGDNYSGPENRDGKLLYKVHRGGDFAANFTSGGVGLRGTYIPERIDIRIGFRLARDSDI